MARGRVRRRLDQGIPLAYTRELADYWADEYDWRAREAALNRFDQYTTEIDGLDIHFIHQRSLAGRRLPVADHPRLARIDRRVPQGDRAVDRRRVRRGVPVAAGVRLLRQAREHRLGRRERSPQAWDTLMGSLGYERYGAQGGDWGAAVTTQIGRNGGRCAAIHVNMPLARPPASWTIRQRRRGRRWRRRLLPEVGLGLLETAVDTSADPRLRVGGFTGRAAGVDRREVLGVDGLRRPPGERAHPRRAPRQRDALLADRVRRRRRRGCTGRASTSSAAATVSSCPPVSRPSRRRSSRHRAAGARPATTSPIGRRCRAAVTSRRSSSPSCSSTT